MGARWDQAAWDEQDMEGEWLDRTAFQLGRQYQCLTMTLEGGLDLLSDLKSLRRLQLKRMNLGMGHKEDVWIRANWPDYGKESQHMLWTSRGHEVPIGSENEYEEWGSLEELQLGTAFDWW